MRKFLLLILITVIGCTLISCEGSDVPDGLGVITVSEADGFKLYCPEGWTVMTANTGTGKTVWGAKRSSYNNISITFTEAEMPDGLPEAADNALALKAIEAYYEKSLADFPENMKVTTVSAPALSNFGNAQAAYKVIYTYKYENLDFAALQYLIKQDSAFYIFTYTSYGDPAAEDSDYTRYYEDVDLSIKSFEFITKSGSTAEAPGYEKDADGDLLVSDRALCGFDLYLPEEIEVICSSGYVTAKFSDTASIYLGKATATGVQINEYWERRKSELERFTDGKVQEIDVNATNKSDTEKKVILGNLSEKLVASYEYKYVIDGVEYHCYQIMGLDSFNGYVFTYTATEAEYQSHLSVIEEIIKKVKF